MKLYVVNDTYWVSHGNNGNTNFPTSQQVSSTQYYLLRPNESKPIMFRIGVNNIGNLFRNFRKEAKKYFSDCPGVLKRIKTGEFKKSDIIEIVEFYNIYCAEI